MLLYAVVCQSFFQYDKLEVVGCKQSANYQPCSGARVANFGDANYSMISLQSLSRKVLALEVVRAKDSSEVWRKVSMQFCKKEVDVYKVSPKCAHEPAGVLHQLAYVFPGDFTWFAHRSFLKFEKP